MPVTGTPATVSADKTTLQGLRTLLVKRTGLTHLVGTTTSGGDTVPDYSVDNGADSFINEAVRWWDDHCYISRMEQVSLAADAYEVTLPTNLLAIEYITLSDATESLLPVNELWMREGYAIPFSGHTSETPLYWCFKGGSDVGALAKTIYVMPPNDISRYLQVHGYFREDELVENADTNWWTTYHWDKVLYVAMQLVLDMDLNPDGNSTLQRLLNEMHRAVIREKVYNEVTTYGHIMRG